MGGLAEMLLGKGYESPNAYGDPNSVGYALEGPAPPRTTADMLLRMAAQKDAKDREGPEAAVRLLSMLAPTTGSALARKAQPLNPTAESTVDKIARWGKAASLHQRDEVKRGNPTGFLEGLAAFPLSVAGSIAAAKYGYPTLSAMLGTPAVLTQPWSVLMRGHYEHTGKIAKYLRDMELREAAKRPPPDNSGTTLSSAPAPLPGIVVDTDSN